VTDSLNVDGPDQNGFRIASGLIHGHKGDAALPLLRATMGHAEQDFPRLALELL
jgi:hypothetical protein